MKFGNKYLAIFIFIKDMKYMESAGRINLSVSLRLILWVAIGGCTDTFKWNKAHSGEFFINTWNKTRIERGNLGTDSNPEGLTVVKDSIKSRFKSDQSKSGEYYFKIVMSGDGEKNSYAIVRRIITSDAVNYSGDSGSVIRYNSDGTGGIALSDDTEIKAAPGDTLKFKYSIGPVAANADFYIVAVKIVPLDLDGRLNEDKVLATNNRIEFTVFRNIAPVAVLQPLTADPANGPRTYILDGSASHDNVGSKYFRGEVKSYSFTISNGAAAFTYTTEQARSPYGFSGVGTFTIVLTVKDNDEGLSDPVKDSDIKQHPGTTATRQLEIY